MTWLKQNWFRVAVALLVVGTFYWFGLREDIISNKCNSYAMERINSKENKDLDYAEDLYRFWYRECTNDRIAY